MKKWIAPLALALTLGVTACSLNIDVHALSPKPAKLMVAKKLDVPLFIVLDAAKIQDSYEVSGFGSVQGMHDFVKRDLVGVMSEYFSKVSVVTSATEVSDARYVLADVGIEKFQKQTVVRAGVGHKILEMTWSFAVRTHDADDYLFSFAGVSQSDAPAASAAEVGTRLIEKSLTGLLDEWAASDAFSKLRSWAADSPPASDEPGSAVQ